MAQDESEFMQRAIALSEIAALAEFTGRPFGAVIVKDGQIIAEGYNRVIAQNDPTWHGEAEAIRKACQAVGTFNLSGCTLYGS
jgi:guanine deaminase